jgi:alpha-glucosidase
MALPGPVYIYQGDELGLPEVEDLPDEVLQDPMFFRSGGTDPGRDGCRVPIPWDADGKAYGFSLNGTHSAPWLPQPESWKSYAASVQEGDPRSMLELYRAALALRRAEPALGDGSLEWIDLGEQVLAFRRGEQFAFVLNLDVDPIELPAHESVLIGSGELREGLLPADTAVWLRVRRGAA